MKLSRYFTLREMRCHDGTDVPDSLLCNAQWLCENLDTLRRFAGGPVKISSGYRTPAHNRKVGGRPASKHLQALAADITIPGVDPDTVYDWISRLIRCGAMEAGGLGRYRTFTHYDVRGRNARWSG